MTKRLSSPLISCLGLEEFQVGPTRVSVKYHPKQTRAAVLAKAEELLPTLELDIPRIEELATRTIGSPVSARVTSIGISMNDTVTHTCEFFAGEYVDETIFVLSKSDGNLVAIQI